MVVVFSIGFEKELKKRTSKKEAKEIVRTLMKTIPTDGKFIALVKSIMIRERRLKSLRFYFVQKSNFIEIMTEEEIKDRILKFVTLSKKNNQKDVIKKLKNDLLENGFKF